MVNRITALAPAGVTKFFGPDAGAELDTLDALRAAADIPYLVSADLEGSRISPSFGTEVPNPPALAAVDDVQASTTIATIMAREARAAGMNWSLTPVIDINAAFRSPIVATRGLGSDPDRIKADALAHTPNRRPTALLPTAKHWPGEARPRARPRAPAPRRTRSADAPRPRAPRRRASRPVLQADLGGEGGLGARERLEVDHVGVWTLAPGARRSAFVVRFFSGSRSFQSAANGAAMAIDEMPPAQDADEQREGEVLEGLAAEEVQAAIGISVVSEVMIDRVSVSWIEGLTISR